MSESQSMGAKRESSERVFTQIGYSQTFISQQLFYNANLK